MHLAKGNNGQEIPVLGFPIERYHYGSATTSDEDVTVPDGAEVMIVEAVAGTCYFQRGTSGDPEAPGTDGLVSQLDLDFVTAGGPAFQRAIAIESAKDSSATNLVYRFELDGSQDIWISFY